MGFLYTLCVCLGPVKLFFNDRVLRERAKSDNIKKMEKRESGDLTQAMSKIIWTFWKMTFNIPVEIQTLQWERGTTSEKQCIGEGDSSESSITIKCVIVSRLEIQPCGNCQTGGVTMRIVDLSFRTKLVLSNMGIPLGIWILDHFYSFHPITFSRSSIGLTQKDLFSLVSVSL